LLIMEDNRIFNAVVQGNNHTLRNAKLEDLMAPLDKWQIMRFN